MSVTDIAPTKQQPEIPDWWKWPLPPLGGLERLPTFLGKRQIKFRSPFSMPGEVKIKLADVPNFPFTSSFPEATFLQNSDKPMEVHRMTARVTPLDADEKVILFTEDVYKSFLRIFRLRIQDVTKNQLITKNSQLLSDLLDESRGSWEWYDPYTMSRSEGFEVDFDLLDFNSKIILPISQGLPEIKFLRLEITFEGYLVVIAPPTNER